VRNNLYVRRLRMPTQDRAVVDVNLTQYGLYAVGEIVANLLFQLSGGTGLTSGAVFAGGWQNAARAV